MILCMLNSINTAMDYSGWMFLIYLLRQDSSRFTRRQLTIGCVVSGAVLIILYWVWEFFFDASLSSQNNFVLIIYILSVPHVFWVYPYKGHKNMFFIGLSIIIMSSSHGFGNLIEQYLPISEEGKRFINLLVSAVLLAFLLKGLVLFVRRYFPLLYESEYHILWKYLWIIMFSLGFLQITVGSVYVPDSFHVKTIFPARTLGLVATAVVLYVAGRAHDQARKSTLLDIETEAINKTIAEKDKQYADIIKGMEQSRRLHHDIRQIYLVIKGFRKAKTKIELAQFCEETLKALKEEKGGNT